MRVTLKLLALIVVLVIGVLGMEAWLRLRSERALHLEDLQRDHHLLAAALAPGLEGVLLRSGLEEARRSLLEAEAAEREVRMRLLGDSAEPIAAELHSFAALAIGAERQFWVAGDEERPDRLVTYRALRDAKGARLLELSESLARIEARLATSRERVMATAFLLLAAVAALGMVAGEWLVGRPLRRLSELTQRVAQTDFTATVGSGARRDEIGELKDSIAKMISELSESWDRVQVEHLARVDAIEQLRRADRLATVGTLAAGLAHELGTPLHVAGGRARLIAESDDATPTIVEDARAIREQCDRMSEIVRSVLDFSRAPSSEKSELSVGDAAANTVSLLHNIASKGGVRLELIRATSDDRVLGSPHHIEQVLTNVVVNAIHASPPDQDVTIRVAHENRSDQGSAGDFVVVRVEDRGPGMEQKVLDRVFDPFFTTKDVGQGTGLGLSIAGGIVSDLGGTIEFEGGPGIGTVCVITFPA